MVRVNIIDVRKLADQHLIAEFNEIFMLIGYVRKHPSLGKIPSRYCLGKGHILFFKNKLLYLKKRHERIAKEMKRRGFVPQKKLDLRGLPRVLKNDWRPRPGDEDIIIERLMEKIRSKPDYYAYAGKKKSAAFFKKMLCSPRA